MVKHEFDCTKHEAVFVRFSAIFRVTDDGATEFGEMNANLMFPAGVQRHSEKRKSSVAFCRSEIRQRVLSAAVSLSGMNRTVGSLY